MASTPATPLRLAVAGLIHETNTYAAEFAGQTPLRAFEQYSGQDQILQAFDKSNHQVGGFIEGARQAGAELVCAYVGQATPSGTIEAQAYAQMKRRILDGLRAALPVDGVLLALHGVASPTASKTSRATCAWPCANWLAPPRPSPPSTTCTAT